MTDMLATFYSTVAMAFAVGHGDNLADTIPLSESHPLFWLLHQAVQNYPDTQLSPKAIIRSLNIPGLPQDIKWPIASILSTVLIFVRDGPAEDEAGMYTALKNMLSIHSHVHKLYQDDYPFSTPLVLGVCRRIVQLSDIAASHSTASMRDPSSPRSIRDTARQALERSMQVVAAPISEWSQMSESQYSPSDALWTLANLLFRIYSVRRLHTQATELAKTLSNLSPSEQVRITRGVPAGVLAESYYWRGRLGIVLLDFRLARGWLDKAWGVCPDGWQQRRSILIKLIPAALLTGSLPAPGLLEDYDLPVFAALVQAFRDGDVAQWRALVEQNREWLRVQNIWLLLFERGEILVWRNLFRHALKAYYDAEPSAPRNRCPTWVFEEAARTAFAGSGELEEDLVLEDVICVLSSLIDQGLLMGNISYSQRQVVMRPRPDGMGGFPRLKDVTPRRVQAIT